MPADPFARSRGVHPEGVWRGTVTRLAASGRPYVEVPRLVAGFEFGPCDLYAPLGATTTAAGAHDDGAGGSVPDHAHDVPALSAGDPVLVAFIEGRIDDPVVLGRRA